MSRSASTGLIAICLASVSGCHSPAPENNQIQRETAERDALVSAAHKHPSLTGEKDATGKPLPPLPGVNAPGSKKVSSEHEGMNMEHEQH